MTNPYLELETGGVEAPEIDATRPPPNQKLLVHLTGKLGALTKQGRGYVTEQNTLTALVSPEGVVATGGWGKWNKVGRRQRTGVTVLEGYEPYQITMPILLDAKFLQQSDIEHQCSILEWFGGRGSLFKGKPGYPGQGEPPIIEVSSESELVPKWCQSDLGHEGSILYVLETIDYNMFGREWITPIRKPSKSKNAGRRTRQAANLTLIQYVGAPGDTQDSAANRVNVLRRQESNFLRFVVGDNINTFKKIAKHFNAADPGRIPDAAREIQKDNSRYGASVDKKLPHGATIRVPESATSKRF